MSSAPKQKALSVKAGGVSKQKVHFASTTEQGELKTMHEAFHVIVRLSETPCYIVAREEEVAPASLTSSREAVSFKGLFTKDLRIMMYGFGDSSAPLDETVDLVENITIEYLKEATLKASLLSHDLLKSRVDEKDLLLSVRKDKPKFSRVRELLAMQETIKQARDAFREDGEDIAAVEALAADEE